MNHTSQSSQKPHVGVEPPNSSDSRLGLKSILACRAIITTAELMSIGIVAKFSCLGNFMISYLGSITFLAAS